ncbi:hypothetical protein V2G26_007061 [Clonostachys chloroleuca]
MKNGMKRASLSMKSARLDSYRAVVKLIEGIQILYSTNIISIAGWCGIIMENLASLTRPQHLSMITNLKLESVVKGRVPYPPALIFIQHDSQLLVDSLAAQFPQLQHVYLLL